MLATAGCFGHQFPKPCCSSSAFIKSLEQGLTVIITKRFREFCDLLKRTQREGGLQPLQSRLDGIKEPQLLLSGRWTARCTGVWVTLWSHPMPLWGYSGRVVHSCLTAELLTCSERTCCGRECSLCRGGTALHGSPACFQALTAYRLGDRSRQSSERGVLAAGNEGVSDCARQYLHATYNITLKFKDGSSQDLAFTYTPRIGAGASAWLSRLSIRLSLAAQARMSRDPAPHQGPCSSL